MRVTIASSCIAVLCGALAVPAAAGGTDRPDRQAAARHAAPERPGAWVPEGLKAGGDVDWFRYRVNAPTHVLVTLGDLPTDAALAVFSSAGDLLGQQDRGGRRFEQVLAAVPAAGDVYVRVSSAAGGGALRYVTQLRVLGGNVAAINTTDASTPTRLRLRGELVDLTSSWQSVRRVRLTFYDSHGGQLRRTSKGVFPEPLAPSRPMAFTVSATKPDGTASYRLVLDTQPTDLRPPRGLHVRHLRQQPGQQHKRLYLGTVVNASGASVDGVYPTVTEYDPRGHVQAIAYAGPLTVPPHGRSDYSTAVSGRAVPKPNAVRTSLSIVTPA